MPKYLFAVLIGLDVLINAIFVGEPYQTMSCRIGLSIQNNGWASRVPWPKWFIQHCMESVFKTIV